jgi:phenylacetate-CoA ligase
MNRPELERQDPILVKQYQEAQLAKVLQYVQENSPYYKRVFNERGIDIHTIKQLEDLLQLPVTTKNDLQQYNNDFLCVPIHKVIDYAVTSGSLGEPVTIMLTDNDLERLAYNEYLSLSCAGVKAGDIIQLMTTIDKRFMAGLAYFLGARKMGAGFIRQGSGALAMQWDAILRHKPNTLICVPSFVIPLLQYAVAKGIDYRNSGIKKLICIGENIRNPDFSLNNLGRRISEQWDVTLCSTYASTEMGCAFTECEQGRGGHHHPELLIIECLDENNMPVAPGEIGELTITTLEVEGMPLVRFKTGDLCSLHHEPCECGRTTTRISPILGRKQQLIKYKGTTLYPPGIFDVLNNIHFIRNYVVEAFTNEIGTDELIIHAGVEKYTVDYDHILIEHLRSRLRVTPKVLFRQPGEIDKMQFPDNNNRKPFLFIDRREAVV